MRKVVRLTGWVGFVGSLALMGGIVGGEQGAPGAQDAPEPVSFAASTSAITVDVVVLDNEGRPVRALTRDDFTVLEDGRPQTVVAFDARELVAEGGGPERSAGPVATNQGASGRPGRVLAFVLDDMGLDPVRSGAAAQKAVARWLEEEADPRDDVTIATTSGDVWWSDLVGRGKADLLVALRRARGKKDPNEVREYISDWEASQIVSGSGAEGVSSHTGALGASRGGERPGAATMGPPAPRQVELGGVLGRVVKRWKGSGACSGMSSEMCEMIVHRRSQEVQDRTLRRRRALVRLVERLSRALMDRQGRKSVVLFSEGFIELPQLAREEKALDAARRANVAVYFVDARGLVASVGESLRTPDRYEALDLGFFSVAGGEDLAHSTGGFAIQSNDLFAGVARAARESSAYYLLGYQPEAEPDGKWHELSVQVNRPDTKVRARRGYYATKALFPQDAGTGSRQASTPLVDPVLLAGGDRDAIPLRLACRPLGSGPDGQRVMVGLDIKRGSLLFDQGRAAVDVTILSLSRDAPVPVVGEQRVTLTGGEPGSPEWWAYTKEIALSAGPAQIKALVREVSTGRSGTVTQRVDVPDHVSDAPRDFEQQVVTLLFEPKEQQREGSLLVRVPEPPSGSIQAPHGHLVLAARIDDAAGQAIGRLTHQWSAGEAGQAHVFRSPLLLQPGEYALESAVLDLETGAASVERRGFNVPPLGGVAVSSVVILGGGAPATNGVESSADPLCVGSVAFVPRIDTRLAKGTPELPMLFRVYPAGDLPVTLSLEVQRDGKALAELKPDTPSPDDRGQLAWLGSLPIASLPPGPYRILVRARQGVAEAEAETAFDVIARTSARTSTGPANEPEGDAEEGADSELARTLRRAAEYVTQYSRSFSDLVAEEVYDQHAPGPGQPPGGRRRTRADIVFVTLEGAFPWGSFRDVYEVDGHAVRDREARLEQLFRRKGVSALEQASAIRAASARYNIGVARTVNEPTLPLIFLLPSNQRRFRFRARGHKEIAEVEGLEVAFEEVARPTLIRDQRGKDVPAKGSFWIDPTGIVLKSQISLDLSFGALDPTRGASPYWINNPKGHITVEYRPEPHLSIWVPSEMTEWYPGTEARARYSGYRRFSVETTETVQQPK